MTATKKKGRDKIDASQHKEQVTFYIEQFKIDACGGIEGARMFCKRAMTIEAELNKTEEERGRVSGVEEFYKTHPHA